VKYKPVVLIFALVLVLAGIELISFLVAAVMLCFGSEMKIMLITY